MMRGLDARTTVTASAHEDRQFQWEASMSLLHPSRRDFLAMSAAAVASSGPGAAFAQAWPSRPVTMVVRYGPGASNDIFTRALSQILSRRLGQPFVVENRAGAGGFTGSNAVAQSAPDGYTFLEAPNSIASFSLIMKVKLDPLTDLMPVALLARSPIGMVINASLPVRPRRSSSTTPKAARLSTAMPASARRSTSMPRCSSA